MNSLFLVSADLKFDIFQQLKGQFTQITELWANTASSWIRSGSDGFTGLKAALNRGWGLLPNWNQPQGGATEPSGYTNLCEGPSAAVTWQNDGQDVKLWLTECLRSASADQWAAAESLLTPI